MKKVRSVKQIKVSTGKEVKRSTRPLTSKIVRAIDNRSKLLGKVGGKGLGNYNLDVMILE